MSVDIASQLVGGEPGGSPVAPAVYGAWACAIRGGDRPGIAWGMSMPAAGLCGGGGTGRGGISAAAGGAFTVAGGGVGCAVDGGCAVGDGRNVPPTGGANSLALIHGGSGRGAGRSRAGEMRGSQLSAFTSARTEAGDGFMAGGPPAFLGGDRLFGTVKPRAHRPSASWPLRSPRGLPESLLSPCACACACCA